MLNKIKLTISKLTLYPYWFLLKHTKAFPVIKEDMAKWIAPWEPYEKPITYAQFCRLMQARAFRNVLYLRLSKNPLLFLSLFYRIKDTLELSTPSAQVGGGLFLIHGFATVVVATSIGKNCTVSQQVTIGWGRGGTPTLEDNVYVGAGAIIVGGITVGHNSKVGAGAVVTKNVPPCCTVVGNPARIIRRNDKKCNEELK
jgi:serine O-acetyltransferase